MRRWHDWEQNTQYYYNESDGMVIGQVHNFGNSSLHTATVKPDNIDKILGYYINKSYAKTAVERYWEIEDRTMIGE